MRARIVPMIVAGLLVVSVGCRSSASRRTKPEGGSGPSPVEVNPAGAPAENADYRNTSISFVDDERYLLRSDRSGTHQIYLGKLSQPRSAPTQLTRFPTDVSFQFDKGMAVLAERDAFVLLHENAYHVFELRTGSKTTYPVPEVEAVFSGSPRTVDGVPDRFYFEVRTKTGRTVIYAQPVNSAGAAPQSLLEVQGMSVWLRDISPDGRYAALTQFVSHTTWTLELADLETGKMKRLYPVQGGSNGRVTSAKFSADGTRVFAGTDGFARKALVALELATGRELNAYASPSGQYLEVWHIAESPSGQRLGLAGTSGNRDRVIVMDSAGLNPEGVPQPEMKPGIGRVEDFVPGTETLVFGWTTPQTFSDLFALDLDRGTTRLLREERASADRGLAMDVYDETIESFDGTKIYLNVYRPKSVPSDARIPVVVHLHGGPIAVSRLTWSADKEFLVRRNIAVVEPNIRGSSGFGNAFLAADDGRKRTGCFEDIKRVGEWLAQQDWADEDRLILSGQSFGGYYVLMGLALGPEIWAAGINMFGISDWRSFFAQDNPQLLQVFRKEVGDIERDGAFLDSISPLRRVERITAPVLFYHGKKDPMVPWTESTQIANRLKSLGRRVEVMIAEDEGHGMRKTATGEEWRARLGRFLDEVIDARD